MFNPEGYTKDMMVPASDVGETNGMYASMTTNDSSTFGFDDIGATDLMIYPDDGYGDGTVPYDTTGAGGIDWGTLGTAAGNALGQVIGAGGNAIARNINTSGPKPVVQPKTMGAQFAAMPTMSKLAVGLAIFAAIYVVAHKG